jgi:hypothetical protein
MKVDQKDIRLILNIEARVLVEKRIEISRVKVKIEDKVSDMLSSVQMLYSASLIAVRNGK